MRRIKPGYREAFFPIKTGSLYRKKFSNFQEKEQQCRVCQTLEGFKMPGKKS